MGEIVNGYNYLRIEKEKAFIVASRFPTLAPCHPTDEDLSVGAWRVAGTGHGTYAAQPASALISWKP